MPGASLKEALVVILLAAVPATAENLLVPLPAKQWNEQAVLHLLRRAAFEGTPPEIKKLGRMSPTDAVSYLVDYDKLPAYETEPLLDPKLATPPPHGWLKEQDEETRRRYHRTRNVADRLQLSRIRGWWLERLITSPRQLEEKMTLFWHGHFTSGYREVRHSHLLYKQNRLFRDFALGNFRELLLSISTDPAMLVYLDSVKNNKKHPNENYARELMELFTLGVGHYTEDDIKAAARAFTGWGLDRGEFKFRGGQHDFGDKVFKGRQGTWNGVDIIDIILADPQSHRFIVTRLWEFFCYDKPEKSVIDGLASLFRKSDFEIKPVLRKILSSTGFYSSKARGSKIKSPVQLAVGTLRLLGVADADYVALDRALASMGQQLFQPPSVKGWDGGEKWITTATVFNRYNFCGGVINGHGGKPQQGMMNRMQAGADEFGFLEPTARRNIGLPPYNPMALLADRGLNSPKQIVDFFAGRLLAVPLTPERQARMISFLSSEKGDLSAAKRNDVNRVRTLIHLLMSTPEYQLY